MPEIEQCRRGRKVPGLALNFLWFLPAEAIVREAHEVLDRQVLRAQAGSMPSRMKSSGPNRPSTCCAASCAAARTPPRRCRRACARRARGAAAAACGIMRTTADSTFGGGRNASGGTSSTFPSRSGTAASPRAARTRTTPGAATMRSTTSVCSMTWMSRMRARVAREVKQQRRGDVVGQVADDAQAGAERGEIELERIAFVDRRALAAETRARSRATMSRSISTTCSGATTRASGRVSAPRPGPISTMRSPRARRDGGDDGGDRPPRRSRKFWLKRLRGRCSVTARGAPLFRPRRASSARELGSPSTRLPASARPVPARSSAVPWSTEVRTIGSPSVTLTPPPKLACLSTGRPWSWYIASTQSASRSRSGLNSVSAGSGPTSVVALARAAARAPAR